MQKTIVLHIGLPKTATTMLQNSIFMSLHKNNDITFLGRSYNANTHKLYYPIGNLINSILNSSNEIFYKKEIYKYQKKLNKIIQKINSKIIIISEEEITVCHKADSYYSSPKQAIEKLGKLFEGYNTKLMISLRNQANLIYSFYVEAYPYKYFDHKEKDTLEKFLKESLKEKLDGDFEPYYYSDLLQACSHCFNINNLNIFIYEDLIYDRDKYIKDLSTLLECSYDKIKKLIAHHNIKTQTPVGYYTKNINIRDRFALFIFKHIRIEFIKELIFIHLRNCRYLHYLGQKFFQFLNYFFSNKNNSKPQIIPFFTEQQKNVIKKHFLRYNKKAEQEFDLDIKKYDYY